MLTRLTSAAVLAAVLTVAAAAGRAQQAPPAKDPSAGAKPAPAAPAAKPVLPLGLATQWPQAKFTPEELAQKFAFQHVPFDKGGFCPYVLPFRYVGTEPDGPHEALALSFLVSASLDWTPGNYCARHAYFCFKTQPEPTKAMMRAYDPSGIAFLVKDWQATHAVGGEIRRGAGGFAGKLEIFDAAGKGLLQKSYDKPRPYFQLLGDMCVDAMTFFGHTPCPALAELLHKDRCKNHQSVVALGKAAFLRRGTAADLNAYASILQRDPGFADVRQWWANQSYWCAEDGRGHNEDALATECAEGFDSYLTLSSLTEVLTRTTNAAVDAKGAAALAAAEKLFAAPHPELVDLRLRVLAHSKKADGPLLRAGTELLAKYPNSHALSWGLAESYLESSPGPADPYMAACIKATALADRFMPAIDKSPAAHQFAQAAELCGAYAAAAEAMRTSRDSRETRARCLRQMGHYAEAAALYREDTQRFTYREEALPRVRTEIAICLALAGDLNGVNAALADDDEALKAARMKWVLLIYKDLLEGKRPSAKTVTDRLPYDFWPHKEAVKLAAQMDLLNGTELARGEVWWTLYRDPYDRELRILADAYEARRASGGAEAAAFYEALDWFYADDPWATAAVAAGRKRDSLMPTHAIGNQP